MKRLANILVMMVVLMMGALHFSAAQAQSQSGVIVCDTLESFTNVNFRLRSTVLDLDYRGNAESIDSLKAVLDSMDLNDILSIEVVSQASPEGMLSLNDRLAKGRGLAINSYICATWERYCGLINMTPAGESWNDLRKMVVADTLLTAKSIKKITNVIDADVNLATKKWRMENILGEDENVGLTYAYLYKKYYPIIRNVGIKVVYLSHIVQDNAEIMRENDNLIPVADSTIVDSASVVLEDIDNQSVVDDSQFGAAESNEELFSDAVSMLDNKTPFYPLLSVKTNLLYDAVVVPGQGYRPILNGIIEYYPKQSNWTALLEYDSPWYSNENDHFYFQAMNLQLEARRYFTNDYSHNGLYASAYVAGNLYDFCFDTKCEQGKQGEGASVGLGFGWVKPISKNGKWKLELSGKVGFYESHYDNYHAGSPFGGKYYYNWDGDNDDFIRRNWRFRWFGPTGVGVTLSYDIFGRKVK